MFASAELLADQRVNLVLPRTKVLHDRPNISLFIDSDDDLAVAGLVEAGHLPDECTSDLIGNQHHFLMTEVLMKLDVFVIGRTTVEADDGQIPGARTLRLQQLGR